MRNALIMPVVHKLCKYIFSPLHLSNVIKTEQRVTWNYNSLLILLCDYNYNVNIKQEY